MKITLKSGEQMEELVALAKNLIGPGDLKYTGDLTPQAASRIISMIFKDDFMSKITTERMTRLTKDVDVIDLAPRQLVRVPQGQEPAASDHATANAPGCKLTALDAQLFAKIKLDTLREHKDDPNLIKLVEEGFATTLHNDLVDLGFNGVADDATGANREAKFVRLNKGWLQILRDSANAKKADIDPATNGWKASLSQIIEAGDERYREQSVFIMNIADADAYAEELNAPITGTAMDADSPLRRYMGKQIIANGKVPQGSVLFTPIKNLVFGMHTDVRRDREYHTIRRALEYTFDMAFDYEVAVKHAAVLGE
ncbi:hypothetical protein ACMA5I_06550 [Paracoccaceae bacterium GXU_MW_L88]